MIDDIINTINAIVYRAIQALESGLLATDPHQLGFRPTSSHATPPPSTATTDADADADADATARLEIEEGVHRIETLLEARVDREFDRLEIYALRNILCVEPGLERWVRLAHHEELALPLPADAPTPPALTALRRRLRATQKLNLALEGEFAANAALLAALRETLGHVAQDGKGGVHTETTTGNVPSRQAFSFLRGSTPQFPAAAFAASQLPALRLLVGRLKERMTGMDGVLKFTGGQAREERRKYIDNTVQRVVKEKVGAEAEVEGVGERRGIEELKSLESIVEHLGNGSN